MKHVRAENHQEAGPLAHDSDEHVHYAGSRLSGQHTLCGWTDTHAGWNETRAKVTCDACLDIEAHVLTGAKAKRKKKAP